VSLGAVTSTCGMAKSGAEIVSTGYRYQKFIQQIVPLGIEWTANVVYPVLSLPVSQTGEGTGTFEMVPAGGIAGGDPYIEIDFNSELIDVDPFYQGSALVTLPVELVRLSAAADERGVLLTWETATEVNNAGFDIERRTAAPGAGPLTWAAVGYVEGSGTCNAPKHYTFRNTDVRTGAYVYRLKQIDRDGRFSYSQEVEAAVEAPRVFALSQNYPNPFNPATTIAFALAEDSRVTVKVYDITGRETASLADGQMNAGYYTLPFDARSLSSGVYFYRLTASHGAASFTAVKRLMVLK